jgi:4-amino-4-deoxy-L-arabinose transferase-like glycosyltransferase
MWPDERHKWLQGRCAHYCLLIVTFAGLMLFNLGTASLWDVDEGNNAEAAREMLESGDWIIPTFNYELRVDKPALLYWMQLGAYRLFGIDEWSARLPSALAALAAVLLTYEIARDMFDSCVGLVAGFALSTATSFYCFAHFANPDTLLSASAALTFLVFWRGLRNQAYNWFVPAGVASGLGVLAKGPIGVVLPAAVIGLVLVTTAQLSRLRDWRLLLGLLAFLVVALPWYVLVTLQTHGAFLSGFLLRHNVHRFLHPMETHSGPLYYYLIVLLFGLAPWSPFVAPALYYLVRSAIVARHGAALDAQPRYLACVLLCSWIAVYLVFFTFAQTKLPNYIEPLYPAVAVVLGYFLERWRQGEISVPIWVTTLCLVCVATIGVSLMWAGWALDSERIDLRVLNGNLYPGLWLLSLLGSIWVYGAILAWFQLGRRPTWRFLAALGLAAILFDYGMGAWCTGLLDYYKAPRTLALAVRQQPTGSSIRAASYQYFQPSLVFYLRRKVARLNDDADAIAFLSDSSDSCLVLPSDSWERLKPKIKGEPRVLAKHYDFTNRLVDVVLVCNR